MNGAIVFDPGQHWLVVAPHPDDEVLGAGGLLQQVLSAGARASVLLLTDGDNNPWPQRWLERRLRLDDAARTRWGRRRRGEVEAALKRLGLDPARDLRALAWTDGQIDANLLARPREMVDGFSRALAELGPTHLVLPTADDRHPDHNAAAVIGVLAAQRLPRPAELLAYRVHGSGIKPTLPLALEREQVRRKRRALEEHKTQLALSRGRFVARVRRDVEAFFEHPFAAALDGGSRLRVELGDDEARIELEHVRYRQWRRSAPKLCVVFEDTQDGLHACEIAIDAGPSGAEFSRSAHRVRARIPAADIRQVFAKVAPTRRGLWIYDEDGWCWSGLLR
jgi:LmbE family N-acetylglucosaminyl deacetylase